MKMIIEFYWNIGTSVEAKKDMKYEKVEFLLKLSEKPGLRKIKYSLFFFLQYLEHMLPSF